MQFDGQTTGIKMYHFSLIAEYVEGLYNRKTILLGTDGKTTYEQRGEVYLLVDANLYSPEDGDCDSLSARLLSLLSVINRKVFDRIWPPRKD